MRPQRSQRRCQVATLRSSGTAITGGILEWVTSHRARKLRCDLCMVQQATHRLTL